MNILITGCNGYIGNAITQRMLNKGYNVIGIDNDHKLKWLKELKSVSAIDVPKNRPKQIANFYNDKNLGFVPFEFYKLDIFKDVKKLEKLFKKYNFDVVINLAQNPSAPYSMKSLKHASYVIQNNTIGCLNLLWLIRNYCPDCHFIEIESMGTFNPAIGVDIPEGRFQFEYNGRKSEPCIFPKEAGSLYHSSKVLNTYLNDCANRWWDLKSTIINQGVVYGNYTDEIDQTRVHSHLTSDECQGTVINRFTVQAMLNHPLTVYGSGEHKRGFLSLNDSVQCLELFVDNPPEHKEMRMVNQIDEIFSINQVAEKVQKVSNEFFSEPTLITHIDSPRVEKTEDFYYNPHTNILQDLGFKQTRSIEDEVKFIFKNTNRNKLGKLKDLVLPKVTWR